MLVCVFVHMPCGCPNLALYRAGKAMIIQRPNRPGRSNDTLNIVLLCVIQKLIRFQNRIADCLVNYSHTQSCIAVRLQRGPPYIKELLTTNCNPFKE